MSRRPSAEQLATAATRLADLDGLPRPLRTALAHAVRECGADLRRGIAPPWRMHLALGEVIAALDEIAAERTRASSEVEFP